jgi:RNase adaptor protein for sRNA GlmZ degradation
MLGSLDNDILQLVIEVLSNELRHTGLIHIGDAGAAHRLFAITLHLVKVQRGAAGAP